MEFFSEMSLLLSGFSIDDLGKYDAIGIVGFGIYLTNYSLVTFQKIDSRGIIFFTSNIAAASCVLLSLSESFNMASALIQVFWICLGVIAIALRLMPKRNIEVEIGNTLEPLKKGFFAPIDATKIN